MTDSIRSFVGDIKEDTSAIREVVEVINFLQTDNGLARLNAHDKPRELESKVEHWLEKMSDYTTYAETAYQATIIDPEEEPGLLQDAPISLDVQSRAERSATLDMQVASERENSKHKLVNMNSGHVDPLRESLSSASLHQLSRIETSSTIQDSLSSPNPTIFSAPLSPVLQDSEVDSQATSASEQLPKESPTAVLETAECRSSRPELDWSPLVPEILPQAKVDALRNSVTRDEEAIERSRQKRVLLTIEDRNALDLQLLSIIKEPSERKAKGTRCLELLDQGATSDSEESKGALQEASQRVDCFLVVVAMLAYGADPETRHSSDHRRPLTLAAATHASIFCALVLAGAKLYDLEEPIAGCDKEICRKSQPDEPRKLYCSPLLAALEAIRQKPRAINTHHFWIAHFLLVNGADPNFEGCMTAMELVVSCWPPSSQFNISKHLFSFGARPPRHLLDKQFILAVEITDLRLLELLLERGAKPGKIARRGSTPVDDPVIRAVAGEHWKCLDVLARQPLDQIHLFNLVQAYMCESTVQLSEVAFTKAAGLMLLAPNVKVDPRKKELYGFPSRWISPVFKAKSEARELVSVIELAKRVKNRNGRDRAAVLRVLSV